MNFQAKEQEKQSGYTFWLAWFIGLVTVGVFFREFLLSGGDLIAGNLGDNRFVISILEYWRAFFHGRASFGSPNFFWPERGVLGYSESLFGLALPYALGRAVGLDQYVSFEFTLALLKIGGFLSIFWLLRSFVKLEAAVSLVGAVLFTISNLYVVSIGHGHLMTVVLVPLLVSLACAAWRDYQNESKYRAYAYAAAVGGLLALILFTSFYIGWFALISLAITILFAMLFSRKRESFAVALHFWPLISVTASFFLIAIVPFLLTYLPKLAATGGRSFDENLSFSSEPIDFINVGSENWMWGGLIDELRKQFEYGSMIPAEVQRGWPPITLSLVAFGFFLAFVNPTGLRQETSAARQQQFLLKTVGSSLVASLALSMRVGGHSLWWLVFRFVPGGSAIRVPSRFNLVLNLLVVVVVCVILQRLKAPGGPQRLAAFWLLVSLLLVEQINTTRTHLVSRAAENAVFSRVSKPPLACSAFALVSPSSSDRPWYANEIDAMLVAEMVHLPTLNGYSGWIPEGWGLNAPLDPDYLQQVRRWAAEKNLTTGICGLDLRQGAWDQIALPGPEHYQLGQPIDFRTGGNAAPYELEGWGVAEKAGSWTVGSHSELLLRLDVNPTDDLRISITAHAFIPPEHPVFRDELQVNGTKVAGWLVNEPEMHSTVVVPRALVGKEVFRLQFKNADPRSPAELGLSADSRKLGLAIEQLKIEANSASK